MSRQQLQALVAQAERTPGLRHRLRWQGSWQAWLEQAQALGYRITAADLRQVQEEERQAERLAQSQLPAIRPLR